MQGIMCVDDVEGLDSAIFQLPVPDLPMLTGQKIEVGSNRSVQTLAVVELGKQLLVAARDGDVDTIRDLMSKGAPFTTDWLGVSPLHLAVQNNHVSTAEMLLRAGISQEARTKVDRTPLHMAAQGGHIESVKLLLRHGADVNCRDMLKMTPLHWAVENQNLDVIETLLRGGADPYAISKFDKTPLSMAIDVDRHDIAQVLQTTDVGDILSLQAPSHTVDQDTLAATESIAAELSTDHNEVTQQIEAGSAVPKKGRPKIRFQMDSKHVNISPSNNQTKAVSVTSLPKLQTTKRIVTTSPAFTSATSTTMTTSSEQASVHGDTETASENSSIHSPVKSTFQLLQDHGITMLPDDDSTTVESAMLSGQTVVLTEAGKMALNLTRVGGGQIVQFQKSKPLSTIATGSVQKRPAAFVRSKSRIIKIHPSQLVALGGGRVQVPSQLLTHNPKGPNILKRVTLASQSPIGTIKTVPQFQRVVITPTQHVDQHLVVHQQTVEVKSGQGKQETREQLKSEEENIEPSEEEDEEEENEEPPIPTDLETIAQELAAARKQAAQFRKQLAKKEREAEHYLQQLRHMKGVAP